MYFILRFFEMGTITKMAPLFGGITFIAAVQAQVETSPFVEIWRFTLTLGIGIFVTLCGVIWRDLNRRLMEQERAQKERHRENQSEIRDLMDKQNKIVGVIVAIAIRMGRDNDDEGDKLFAALQAILK